jgi:hypothetical protein
MTYYGTKMKSEAVHPRVIDSPNLLLDTRIKVTLVARPLLMPAAQMVYSRAEHVSILENYFASKSFAAVLEEFSNA